MKKKISLIFILALVLQLSCTSFNYWKVNVELSGVATLNLDQFEEVVISNFLVKKETKDFDLNQELIDFFSAELSKHFKGDITTREISWEEKEVFQQEEFWKNLWPESEESLVLTGSVEYSEETRKAILSSYSREQGFSSDEKGIAERKFYTLILNLYLIEAKTGAILYQTDLEESKGYKNPKQTAIFAFFELMDGVKEKFLRKVLGEKRQAQRYLISK